MLYCHISAVEDEVLSHWSTENTPDHTQQYDLHPAEGHFDAHSTNSVSYYMLRRFYFPMQD